MTGVLVMRNVGACIAGMNEVTGFVTGISWQRRWSYYIFGFPPENADGPKVFFLNEKYIWIAFLMYACDVCIASYVNR